MPADHPVVVAVAAAEGSRRPVVAGEQPGLAAVEGVGLAATWAVAVAEVAGRGLVVAAVAE